MYNGSEEVFLEIDNHLLSGLSNVAFSHSRQESSNLLLVSGARKIHRRETAPPSVTCTFDRTYMNQDYVKTLTGRSSITGTFRYGTGLLDFDNAVISKYSVSVSPESLPKTSVTMDIYGLLKPGLRTDRRGDKNTDDDNKFRYFSGFDPYKIEKISPTGISLNYDNKTSPVQSFNYTASFKFVPTYEILPNVRDTTDGRPEFTNRFSATTVKLLNPINIETSATLELLEPEFENITGLIGTEDERFFLTDFYGGEYYPNARDIEFSIKGETGNVLDEFPMPQALLQSQNMSITTNDTIKLSLSHLGHMFADY